MTAGDAFLSAHSRQNLEQSFRRLGGAADEKLVTFDWQLKRTSHFFSERSLIHTDQWRELLFALPNHLRARKAPHPRRSDGRAQEQTPHPFSVVRPIFYTTI